MRPATTQVAWRRAAGYARLLSGRFGAIIGLQPDTARHASKDPSFLAGLLDYVMTDDALLVDCATAIGEPPERAARRSGWKESVNQDGRACRAGDAGRA